MVHPLTEAMESRRRSTIHFEATCYKITRIDGVQLFLTDAQGPMTLEDGDTYTPAGGFQTTARRKATELDDQNYEGDGVLTADVITHLDMKAGRYLGARIDTFIIDFRFPWAGHFHHTTNYVTDTRYDRDAWNMQVEGFTSKLKQVSGLDASITCENELADAFNKPLVNGCKADLAALGFTFEGHRVEALDVSAPKRRFIGTDIVFSADEFQFGKITWTSGLNSGIESRIRSHSVFGALTLFEFYLELPNAIVVGDNYNAVAGCNKIAGVADDTIGHCIDKFDQILNFQGEPFLPGMGRVLRRPL